MLLILVTCVPLVSVSGLSTSNGSSNLLGPSYNCWIWDTFQKCKLRRQVFSVKTLAMIVFSVLHRWVLFAVHEVPLISHCQGDFCAPLFISHT